MTQQTTPPAAVTAFIDATNSADSDAFVAAFTDDAYVRDWGREFTGHDGVASWNRSDNIGVGMHFELIQCEEKGEDRYIVRLKCTSRRFNGTGDMRMTLRNGLISRLEIDG
jgi:ketosteroid isomerase-like protein